MVSRLAFGVFGFFSLVLPSDTSLASDGSPLQIVVSKQQQSLVVYEGDTVIATSRVSTGKPGHSTPTGIFSILEKHRHHRSNLYSNAPMPFMQRLTWSGIALHASNHVPDYPASHGCVRLPDDFARQLFRMTERGVHVVISDAQLIPASVSHSLLMLPESAMPLLLSDVPLRPSLWVFQEQSVEVAMSAPIAEKPAVTEEADGSPIRILITRRDGAETTRDVQLMLTRLGFDAGPADARLGSRTIEAIKAFQTRERLPIEGRITKTLVEALNRKTGAETPPNGQLMIRRNFTPLFEAPVTINQPEIALGTHFFFFGDSEGDDGGWYAMTLDNHLTDATRTRLGITKADSTAQPPSALASLDRIVMADNIRERIAALLAEGSSLTISDTGLGPETGKGTDFVTITHSAPRS